MRIPIIAGNWKMNKSPSESLELVNGILKLLPADVNIEVVVCPPFTSIVPVFEILKGSKLKLGAQNMYYQDKGAYTGEVSPLMLKGYCEYVIIGHSERRQYFNESDEMVNRKIKAALNNGLKSIVCVGENLEQNEKGLTERVVTSQIINAFKDLSDAYGTVIAYEPIWAIGTGRAATGKDANSTIALIRDTLQKLYGDRFAREIRIQYGGSVTPSNISEFMSQPDIDGALVGGASLKAEDFINIIKSTQKAKYKNTS